MCGAAACPGGAAKIRTLGIQDVECPESLRLPDEAPFQGRYTAVVVGAGFTGVEPATAPGEHPRAISGAQSATEDARVVLFDPADVVGPEPGPGPRPTVGDALDELRTERRLGRTATSVTRRDITLSDGEVLPAATVVWTAGMAASPLTAEIPNERDRLGRLSVDEYLRVAAVPGAYAAGDTALAAVGTAPLPFTPDPYVTCLDLGWDGRVRPARGPPVSGGTTRR